jgi:hypothetical protein
MAKLLSFESPDGRIEIAVRTPEDSITAVGVVQDAIETASDSFVDVLSIVSSISDSVRAALSKCKAPPACAEIQFGLQFTAKGTIYVVETQAASSLSVKLIYKTT